ncbi:GTPase domain-containing protein [Stenotrophomonas sp.]|uniref:GTPase domain-containing protein n=1 Tax=Stenotrophomonas sp. TaxID=69392 RepID=UPI0028A796FF|nr:GTPase domain-containing protein [Stenotrophomonas sp.]
MKINALVLGKSGAGKSSLINYLWGSKQRDTGAGRPVTPEEEDGRIGIYPSDPLQVAGHSIVIHDSHGLEADRAEKWSRVVRDQMKLLESTDSPEDWFHAVIYCVDAKRSRLEDFEIEHVIRPLLAEGHPVTIVLTKSDLASEAEAGEIEKVIRSRISGDAKIIRIGSEEKLLRNGKKVSGFGKEQLIDCLLHGFIRGISLKFEARYRERFAKHCISWRTKTLEMFKDRKSLFRSTATTLQEVEAYSKATLDQELELLSAWATQVRNRLLAISLAFGRVLDVDPRRSGPAKAQAERLAGDRLQLVTAISAWAWVSSSFGFVNMLIAAWNAPSPQAMLELRLDASIERMKAGMEEQLGKHNVLSLEHFV